MAKLKNIPLKYSIALQAFVIVLLTGLIVAIMLAYSHYRGIVTTEFRVMAQIRSELDALECTSRNIAVSVMCRKGLDAREGGFLQDDVRHRTTNMQFLVSNIREKRWFRREAVLLQVTDSLSASFRRFSYAAEGLINIARAYGRGDSAIREGVILKLTADQTYASRNIKVFSDSLDEQLLLMLRQRIFLLNILSALTLILLGLATALFIYTINRRLMLEPLKHVLLQAEGLAMGKITQKTIDVSIKNDLGYLATHLDHLRLGQLTRYEFTRSLAKGDIEADLLLTSESDILGKELQKLKKQLQESAEERRQHDEENARRRYINEGLAMFSELMHGGYESIERLTDSFIRELTKYMHALQGAIFLIDDEKEGTFRLASAFAYNRKRYLEKSIRLGQGLVGTCAMEKKSINLTELPDDYLVITSGLGDALPTNLLIVPMKIEEEVLGVIEVASLTLFNDHELEFMEQVAGSLASMLQSVKTSERTSTLLAQSQQQAQEMMEQEEEMRQNMEELKATQEESARREEEFRGLYEAFNLSGFLFELTFDGEVTSVNERFLIFTGANRSEALGRKFAELVQGKKTGDITLQFLEEVRNGNMKILHDSIKLGKKTYPVKFSFIPVLNKDQLPVKIVCIGTEMAE